MTKRSKVAWQPVAAPNSSAWPPLPVAVLGAVVNGGSPRATAAKHSDDASAARIAHPRNAGLPVNNAFMSFAGLDDPAAQVNALTTRRARARRPWQTARGRSRPR